MNLPLTYPMYRALFVGFVALALAALAYWMAARPSRPTSRFGLRGRKRQQSLLRAPAWAAVEPLVRWTGVRVSGLVGEATRIKLDAQLTYAGDYLGLTADEYVSCMIIAGSAAALLGAALVYATGGALGPLPIPVLALFGAAAPYMIVDGARAERLKAINRGLPYAIDLMALAMSAGLDFPGAVHQVVDTSKANEALREELAYLLHKIQLGTTRTQALHELAARAPLESVREFVQALVQAEERGNPVSAALEIQAATARTRRTNAAEKGASDMKAKMVLPTMMLIAVGLALIAVPSSMMLDRFTGGAK